MTEQSDVSSHAAPPYTTQVAVAAFGVGAQVRDPAYQSSRQKPARSNDPMSETRRETGRHQYVHGMAEELARMRE
jgi:hypothetical protein